MKHKAMQGKQLSISFLAVCAVTSPVFGAPSPAKSGTYQATAYSVTGITASGEWTHRHVVAADPDILPIGSRIKVKRAGRYSGEYVVADTGTKIVGRKLDIYMPGTKECIKFGTKRVKVYVIQIGDGTQAATKQADQAVKQEVNKDIAKGVVGNSATEADWKAKGAQTLKTIQPMKPPIPTPPPAAQK